MKKFFAFAVGCLLVTTVSAQTLSKGSIFVDPTLTNLGLNSVTIGINDDSQTFSRFGLQATGGYVIMDDLAIVGGVGFQSGKYESSGASLVDIFAGARYYVIPNMFVGANALLGNLSINNKEDDSYSDKIKGNTLSVQLNGGYSYFLSERFAVEPSISYTLGLSTKIAEQSVDLSIFSINVGFIYLL